MTRFSSILAAATLFCTVSCTESATPNTKVENINTAATPAVVQATPVSIVTDDAPRISLADAKKDFDARSALFIDTHSKEQYEIQHIPGSMNIPLSELQTKLDKIPKGKKIIAYCS